MPRIPGGERWKSGTRDKKKRQTEFDFLADIADKLDELREEWAESEDFGAEGTAASFDPNEF